MLYLEQLSLDKKMASILDGEPYTLKKQKRIDFYLCSSIMSQQLSVKVAAVIKQRFLALYEGNPPIPQQILDTPFESLRGIGLSNAKVNYIQNVARFAMEQGMDWKKLEKLSNEEVIIYLTQIKGVGRWTVEMLLMFAMGREDVFAVDDLGIQMAMKKLYKLDDSDKKTFKEKMLKISKKWAPYRTYACIHLWKWKDNGPAV
ncbi:DNA-3-methyladenine glycosylase family protein [Flavihumibacter sp. UBA7668]|uniref:DNA-3-methyladenine glycosylase family protein n=1 Tax=Flavihumibacter sp. UBA7668 TaxID=1946542 RepID=UPI0025C61A9B|nr:DNA-3-methyladenine glycosylase 2 family protein [Flavihumibacter sp. UBA7668]